VGCLRYVVGSALALLCGALGLIALVSTLYFSAQWPYWQCWMNDIVRPLAASYGYFDLARRSFRRQPRVAVI